MDKNSENAPSSQRLETRSKVYGRQRRRNSPRIGDAVESSLNLLTDFMELDSIQRTSKWRQSDEYKPPRMELK